MVSRFFVRFCVKIARFPALAHGFVHSAHAPHARYWQHPRQTRLVCRRSSPELPAAFAGIAAHRPEVTSLRWCSVGADDALVETLLARTGWPTRRLVAAAEVGGVRLAYRTPHTLGVDRLAAVLGARSLQPQGHLLVIDAGTCITFDVLLADGRYIGGNISPGLSMRLAAMHAHTARLPLVDAQGELPLLGLDTPTALRGIAYEIEGYVRRLREEYGAISTFLTGGNRSDFPVSAESCTFADEYLVARGLATDF